MPRPTTGEAPTYFFKYIQLTQGDTIDVLIKTHAAALAKFYQSLPNEKADYAYGAEKWTVKQVLQHVLDTERVFVYRMLCFARGQESPLPSMDENEFAKNAPMAHRNLDDLKEEFILLRQSTDSFLLSLTEDALKCSGIASGNHLTVNALAYIIYGHLLHHQQILTERYLS